MRGVEIGGLDTGQFAVGQDEISKAVVDALRQWVELLPEAADGTSPDIGDVGEGVGALEGAGG